MSADNLSPIAQAENQLIRLRDCFLAQAEQLNQTIASLRAMGSLLATMNGSGIPSTIEDYYRGTERMTALEQYLRQRKGQHIPLDRVVKDLLFAGVDPGMSRGKNTTEAGRLTQNLKLALGQEPNRKRRLFEFSPPGKLNGVPPEQITIWLASTAEDPPKGRVRVKQE